MTEQPGDNAGVTPADGGAGPCIFVLLTAFGGLPARAALANRVVDNLIGSVIAVAALWL